MDEPCSYCGRVECSGAPRFNGVCNMPKDPAEKGGELHTSKRIQSWTIERWIQFIEEHPECSLPNGVGGRLVTHYKRLLNENKS